LLFYSPLTTGNGIVPHRVPPHQAGYLKPNRAFSGSLQVFLRRPLAKCGFYVTFCRSGSAGLAWRVRPGIKRLSGQRVECWLSNVSIKKGS